MNLIDTFKIKNKDIITIVGAGGKTSLMFSASSLLRIDFKVLVTTTTHIYIPDEKFYDDIIMLSDFEDDKISMENETYDDGNLNNQKYYNIIKNNKRGVYVIGNYIVNSSKTNKNKIENSKVNGLKIKGLTFDQLDKIIPYFDIVIIEGDGSKEKCLKGWNDSEPVIYSKTTKTIGVVDISSIGIDINEDNIHRLDRFLDIINHESSNKVNNLFKNSKCNLHNKVKIEHLKNMILNKYGLFKISKGERILFINKNENINNKKDSFKLIKSIKEENPFYIDNFIYGSILRNEFIKG